MRHSILTTVDEKIKAYQEAHQGQQPLYIILSDEQAEQLITAVKEEEGYGDHIVITEWHGCKIARDIALKPDEIRLSDELPETGS